MTFMRVTLLAASTLTLVSCGATETNEPVRTPPVIEAVQLRPCPAEDFMNACASDHAQAPGYLRDALAGDYQAQRNVSYMHTSSMPWNIQRPIQGCAWRMVIMATRPSTSTLDDAGMYRIQCGSLNEADLADAKTLANGIHRRLHGSDLPPIPAITA